MSDEQFWIFADIGQRIASGVWFLVGVYLFTLSRRARSFW